MSELIPGFPYSLLIGPIAVVIYFTIVNCAVASCPAHQDQRPSLSIEKKKEIFLLKCHAGCSFREIVNALGMSLNEFKTKKRTIKHKKEVFRYAYHDKNGDILAWIIHQLIKVNENLAYFQGIAC